MPEQAFTITNSVPNGAPATRWRFMSYDCFVLASFSAALLAQACILGVSPLGLAGDEAYYWLWSKRLDFSYYEKGPGIAYLIALGRHLFGDTEFGVRFGALCGQGITGALLYCFSAASYGRRAATFLLLLYCSTLLFGSLGLFMTGDPPLCAVWMIALIGGAHAAKSDCPRWWLLSFTAVGVASLFKFSSLILIPSFGLYLLFTPSRRHQLKSPEFWLGAVLALLVLAPVIYWNAVHNWINFSHNAGHLNGRSTRIKPQHIAELVFGQWGLVGVLLFPKTMAAFYQGMKRWRRGDVVAGVYLWAAMPLLFLCLFVSFTRPVYANWPMPAFLSALLLIVHLHPELASKSRSLYERQLVRAGALNFVVLLAAHLLLTGYTFGIPSNRLPTKKLVGWQSLAQNVNELMRRDGGKDAPFVITEKYMTASELEFYVDSHPQVFVTDVDEPKLSQYDVWGGWKALKGRNALLVYSSPDEMKDLVPYFAKIEPAEISTFDVSYGPRVERTYYFYRAYGFKGDDLAVKLADG